MCGIAGIFKSDGRFTVTDVEAVLTMLDAQTHRGPDDWGLLLPHTVYANEQVRQILEERELLTQLEIRNPHVRVYKAIESRPAVILGSRRLSILDLSPRGRMPMSNANETLWLTHNGEIYNCPELRQELSSDFTFRSQTDTEVLLAGYEKWGDKVLDHLRGMFAFALFDTRAGRLLLARDRFGIKPLYYTGISDAEISDFGFRIANFEGSTIKGSIPQSATGNPKSEIRNSKFRSEIRNSKLLFSSEVRAIVKSGLAEFEPEPEAIVRFLQLGSVPAPLTTVKNVFALPAGHSLVLEDSTATLAPYWDLSSSKPEAKEESQARAIDKTRRLLDETTRQHLLSDVPLGIFLSGGIDSSALVAVARKFREQPLTTLSIIFDEPEYNEAKYARLIANHYGTEHHEILLTGRELFDELPQVFAAMDQPTVDGVNSFFISRAAKQVGLKVVLSGLGGDEVFLGYNHLRKAQSLNSPSRLLQKLPSVLRKALIQMAVPAGSLLGRSGLEKLNYLQEPSSGSLYLLFRGLFTPGQIQKLMGLSDSEMKQYGVLPPSINGAKAESLTDSFVVNDFQHYLQNQLLKDTDCMSMAHSIEARVPFLDHELVSYVFGLPRKFKLDSEINKPLLIAALGDDFPRAIWDRPKMGFTFPFAVWLREGMKQFRAKSAGDFQSQGGGFQSHGADFFQPNGSTAGIFDSVETEKIWQGFHDGRVHWSRPWALMVLSQFNRELGNQVATD